MGCVLDALGCDRNSRVARDSARRKCDRMGSVMAILGAKCSIDGVGKEWIGRVKRHRPIQPLSVDESATVRMDRLVPGRLATAIGAHESNVSDSDYADFNTP